MGMIDRFTRIASLAAVGALVAFPGSTLMHALAAAH